MLATTSFLVFLFSPTRTSRLRPPTWPAFESTTWASLFPFTFAVTLFPVALRRSTFAVLGPLIARLFPRFGKPPPPLRGTRRSSYLCFFGKTRSSYRELPPERTATARKALLRRPLGVALRSSPS